MRMEKPHFKNHKYDDVRLIDLKSNDFRIIIGEVMSDKLDEFAKTLATLPPSDEDLLTRKQTAERFNITLPTLSNWTKTGKLKSCKVPGSRRVYYRADQIKLALRDRILNVRK
jgi:hypothetical protein